MQMINHSWPQRDAIIIKDQKISYEKLLGNIHSMAKSFIGVSCNKVAIFSENRLEWIYAFYAAWLKGAIVVPVDFMASPSDIAYILDDCRPELIFTSRESEKTLRKALKELDYKPEVQVFEKVRLEKMTKQEVEFPVAPEDTAVIIYTSGTTGDPKGVMLSFANLQANIRAVSEKVVIYTPERQVLMLLPLHHIFPLAGSMMAPLFVGGSIVMAPSMQSADMLETLKNNRVAIMIGVPRLYELIYKGLKAKIEASRLAAFLFLMVKASGSKVMGRKIFKKVHVGLGGHLEFMVAGGAALNKEVGAFFKTLGFDVLEGFGMTEAAPMITFTRPGMVKIGSPGQVLPGMEIEIRDGEIAAKGPNVMKGYYNRPEETAEVLRDGWLHTGDLGRIDKDGYLYITGRKKEIIVLSNGKNINPVELEQKLENAWSMVKEAAVILHKDHLHAAIVPDLEQANRSGVGDLEHHFRDIVLPGFNQDQSSYKRIPRFTLLRQDIPRTRLGKIQRHKLSELIEVPSGKTTREAQPQTKEFKTVKRFIEAQVDMDVAPEHHLEYDIALDSLGKISLIDFIERTFGVSIPEDKIAAFPSIREMTDHIHNQKKWFKPEEINWTTILKEKVQLNLPRTWPTQNLIKSIFSGLFRIYFRLKGEGYQSLPEGPFILAPNHQSYLDGFLVASFLRWKVMRHTYVYAKKEHLKGRLTQFLARRNNIIIMDLNKDLKLSIQKLAEVLKKGRNIMIFPEGTRSADGLIGEFKNTFAILSAELNVPVVPVAIRGAYQAMPRGARFPRPFKRIHVNFLEPVQPLDYSFDGLARKVREVISDSIEM